LKVFNKAQPIKCKRKSNLDSGCKKVLHSSESEGLFVKLWKEGVYRAASLQLLGEYGERQVYSCCRTEQDDLEKGQNKTLSLKENYFR
jgi:hypothetical protein